METYIITAHEEEYSNKTRILGILLNVNDENERVDSLAYVYHSGMYVFFNTIIEMNEYLLYGDKKMRRAYMKEDNFDVYYDGVIEGKFSDHLDWITT